MTHSGGKPHKVGDRGQRYQVTYMAENPESSETFPFVKKILSWTDDLATAERMAQSILAHPTWRRPEIEDRAAAREVSEAIIGSISSSMDKSYEQVASELYEATRSDLLRAFRAILATPKGERVARPNFETNIRDVLARDPKP